MEDLSTLILAGGLGSRLIPAVSDRPKVLATVNGRPFLACLLDQLVRAGIHDVILCIGYRGQQVRDAFGERYGSLQIRYSTEEQPLGTAGAIRNAAPLIKTNDALIMNGDSYCQADLGELRAAHFSNGAKATLLLAEIEDISRFGRVMVDDRSQVTSFEEKMGRAIRGWINAGIYLAGHEFIADIEASRCSSLEREVFPAWIGRGLFGYQSADSRFLDIGTPESYAQASQFLAESTS